MIARAAVFVMSFILLPSAFGYEQATHALITNAAFKASDFFQSTNGSRVVEELGLNMYQPFGSKNQYVEFSSTLPVIHTSQLFERRLITDLSKVLNPIDTTNLWLMYGAIREDDNPAEDPPTPQDIAPGLRRPLHHFYDPYLDRALTMPFLDRLDPDIHKNPDWAIGSRDSFTKPNEAEASRRNVFTILDAREAMFRALTLKTFRNGIYVNIAPGDLQLDEEWRQAYWATTFRALGDVLHLNQDMAQPQHTRNEAHSGQYCFSYFCPAGHTSVYEKYINARALQADGFDSLAPYHVPVRIAARPLAFPSYPVPNFAKYTDYWATSPGDALVRGKGLAEFSNRGFFTAAKNFGSQDYPLPSSNVGDYVVRDQLPSRWDGSASENMKPVKVYYGTVRDTFQDQLYVDIPQTTFGVWDQFLQQKSRKPKYSLNRLNYDAMADMLLPRAVAYSAGLINFFFRGRLQVALPQEGVFAVADHSSPFGFKTLRVKLRNVTGSFADPGGADQPQHMRGGTFFAVIRYHKDKKYVDSLDTVVGMDPCDDFLEVINPARLSASTECREGTEQIVVSKPVSGSSLDADEEKTLKFSFVDKPIPYEMTDVVLQIVYRGPIGSETDAVAVGTMDIPEPTYFAYHNASDYIHLGEHVYTRAEVNADPGLLALVQPQYCIDYRQNPPKLDPSCLTQFTLDIDLSFGDISSPLVRVQQLSTRRFFRVAYLTAEDPPAAPVEKAARKIRLTVAPRSEVRNGSAGLEKAMLHQQGTCLPLDPFDVPPRHSQMIVTSPTEITYRLGRFNTLRGVNGWFSTSCVVNGDDAEPGTPDDRNSVMTPIAKDTEEGVPFPVTISEEYL